MYNITIYIHIHIHVIHIIIEINSECGLTLTTSLHQPSLNIHQTTLTPRILIIIHFQPIYIYNFNPKL